MAGLSRILELVAGKIFVLWTAWMFGHCAMETQPLTFEKIDHLCISPEGTRIFQLFSWVRMFGWKFWWPSDGKPQMNQICKPYSNQMFGFTPSLSHIAPWLEDNTGTLTWYQLRIILKSKSICTVAFLQDAFEEYAHKSWSGLITLDALLWHRNLKVHQDHQRQKLDLIFFFSKTCSFISSQLTVIIHLTATTLYNVVSQDQTF